MAQILVIDDNEARQHLLEEMLLAENYQVTCSCINTVMPLSALADSGTFDIILLDCTTIDGIGLLKQWQTEQAFRQSSHAFRLIALLDKRPAATEMHPLTMGADDYLLRPFHPVELLTRLTTQLKLIEAEALINDVTSLTRLPAESPNPMFRVATDGTLLYCNIAGVDLLPATEDEGKLYIPASWRGCIAQIQQTKTVLRIEYETDIPHISALLPQVFRCTFVPFIDDGYVNIYGTNITDLKQTEQRLQKTEEYLRAVLSHIPLIIFALDSQGVFTVSEGKGLRLLGRESGQVVGQSIFDVYQDHALILNNVRRALAGERCSSVVEISGMVFETHYEPLHDSHHQIKGIVGIAYDITEREQLEKTLQEANEQLESRVTERTLELQQVNDQLQTELDERKRIEVALRDSEMRFRSVAQSAREAVISADGRGRIIYWNKGAETIFAYQEAEIIKQPFTRLVPERQRQAYQLGLEQFYLSQASELAGTAIEVQGLRKDGTEFPCELSLATWDINNKPFYTAIIRDITDRKQAEANLKRRNEELATLNNIAAIISKALDLDEALDWALGQTLDVLDQIDAGAIFVLTDAGQDLQLRAHRGLSAEVVQQAVRIMVDDGPYGQVMKTGQTFYQTTLHTAQLFPYFAESESKAHLLIPLQTEGTTHGVLAVYPPANLNLAQTDMRLITAIGQQIGMAIERAQLFSHITTLNRSLEERIVEATLELRREKERLDMILRHVPDGILFTDREGLILYANPAFETITGYLVEMVHGQPLEFLGGQITPQEIYADIWTTVKQGQVWEGDLQQQHQDGQTYDAQLILAPIRSRDGEVINVVGSLRDITQLKELDLLKSQFVSTVSHELRTPVTAIQLHIENLIEFFDLLSAEERQDSLNEVKVQTETLGELIEDILHLSRLDAKSIAPTFAYIDFSHLLQEIYDEMMPLATKGEIDLQMPSTDTGLQIEVDRAQIKNVLRNLLSNAIKFTPAGGTVICQLENSEQALILQVSDTGMGIPAESLTRIFDRFYRGHHAESQHIPGTGLGLSIVKQIISDHQGQVSVASVEGEGTTFTIRLPYQQNIIETGFALATA